MKRVKADPEERVVGAIGRWQELLPAGFDPVLLVAVLLLLVDAVLLFRSIHGDAYWRTSTDFGTYLNATLAIAHGNNPYSIEGHIMPLFYGVPATDRYVYPPLLAEVLLPLAHLSLTLTRYVWLLVSVVCLVLSFSWLLRSFGARLHWHWVALAVAVTGSTYAARNDLYHGQVNFALLWLLTAGALLYTRNRPALAGFAWGLMLVVKPFLGVIALYLLWKRSWRAAIATILSSAIVLLLSFVPTFSHGATVLRSWISTSQAFPDRARPDNYSLHGTLLRLFTRNPYTHPWLDSSALAMMLGLASIALLILALVAALPPRPVSPAESGDQGLQLLAELGLVIGAGYTYGPLTEGDHLFLLLPGLIGVLVLARRRWNSGMSSRRLWLAAALVWAGIFVLRASPIHQAPFGLRSPDVWVPMRGASILWTGQIAVPLGAAVVLLACAMWRDRVQNEQVALQSSRLQHY